MRSTSILTLPVMISTISITMMSIIYIHDLPYMIPIISILALTVMVSIISKTMIGGPGTSHDTEGHQGRCEQGNDLPLH